MFLATSISSPGVITGVCLVSAKRSSLKVKAMQKSFLRFFMERKDTGAVPPGSMAVMDICDPPHVPWGDPDVD